MPCHYLPYLPVYHPPSLHSSSTYMSCLLPAAAAVALWVAHCNSCVGSLANKLPLPLPLDTCHGPFPVPLPSQTQTPFASLHTHICKGNCRPPDLAASASGQLATSFPLSSAQLARRVCIIYDCKMCSFSFANCWHEQSLGAGADFSTISCILSKLVGLSQPISHSSLANKYAQFNVMTV